MRIVAFYSFKGGVGRTTAMLNVAYRLAQEGRKVVAADWDLHAPGLSVMELLRDENGQPPTVGVLEWLCDLRSKLDNPSAKRRGIAELVLCPRLVTDAQSRPDGPDADPEQPRMKGELLFIPAGDLSSGADTFARRIKDAGLHDLQRFFVTAGSDDKRFVFKVFCEELRETLLPWRQPEFNGPPDYLLVDCRTGLTEIGDLLLGDATDFNVIVYAHDPQNLAGLEIALNARPRMPWELQNNTLLLWTMEPLGQEQLKIGVRRLKKSLIEKVCQRDTLGLREAFPQEFNIPYHPELALTNDPITHRFGQCELSTLFGEVAKRVEQKCHWRDELIEELRTGFDQASGRMAPSPTAQVAAVLRSSEEDERLYRDARAEIALARPLISLLFAPPTFDFVGARLDDLCNKWPEDLDAADRLLLANLISWSISLSTNDKNNILRTAILSVTPKARQDLLGILRNERSKFLTMSGAYYWGVLWTATSAMLEWWLYGGTEQLRSSVANELVRPLLQGRIVGRLPVSSVQMFPFLMAMTVAHALAKMPENELTEKEGTDYSSLRDWLENQDIDWPSRLLALTSQAVDACDHEQLQTVAPYAWRSISERLLVLGRRGTPSREQTIAWIDSAVIALEKALRLEPDDAATLHNLGHSLDKRGRVTDEAGEKADWFDRAIAAYTQSLAKRPDDAGTLNNLGSSLGHRGRVTERAGEKADWFDRAIAAYTQSLAKRPDDAGTLYNLGNSLNNRGRVTEGAGEKADWFDRAIAVYTRSLAKLPDDAGTLNNLGNSLDDRGRVTEGDGEKADWFDRAIAAYSQSLAKRPDDAGTLYNLGNSLDRRGQVTEGAGEKADWFDRAIAAYTQSLAKRPDHVDTLDNLASTMLKQFYVADAGQRAKLLDEAKATIQRARNIDAKATRYNYCCVLSLSGQHSECVEELRQLLLERPDCKADIAKDPDFQPVAHLPEFRELIAPLEWAGLPASPLKN